MVHNWVYRGLSMFITCFFGLTMSYSYWRQPEKSIAWAVRNLEIHGNSAKTIYIHLRPSTTSRKTFRFWRPLWPDWWLFTWLLLILIQPACGEEAVVDRPPPIPPAPRTAVLGPCRYPNMMPPIHAIDHRKNRETPCHGPWCPAMSCYRIAESEWSKNWGQPWSPFCGVTKKPSQYAVNSSGFCPPFFRPQLLARLHSPGLRLMHTKSPMKNPEASNQKRKPRSTPTWPPLVGFWWEVEDLDPWNHGRSNTWFFIWVSTMLSFGRSQKISNQPYGNLGLLPKKTTQHLNFNISRKEPAGTTKIPPLSPSIFDAKNPSVSGVGFPDKINPTNFSHGL